MSIGFGSNEREAVAGRSSVLPPGPATVSVLTNFASTVVILSRPRIEELMRAFWAEHALTGDNTMERPYSNLQAKLTARSNVFRVHFRAQAIRKSRSSEASQFDPEKDRVVGEYRGDTVFERHLPPERPVTADAASRYPDYVREAAAASLDRYYHYRVIEHRRFSR